jgi:hypothetical protein
MTAAGAGDKLSFEPDIKPFFRQKDRDSMAAAFDLFDYGDVVENAEAIVGSAQRADALRRRLASRAGGAAPALDRPGHTRVNPHITEIR